MTFTTGEARIHYEKALHMGKKEGGSPVILDKLLEHTPAGIQSEYPLGIVSIPLEQVIGTKSEGRAGSFSKSFFPLLLPNTEFAGKWIRLCRAHLVEGIHDPIKVYEYMNRFYVSEGNKRVSVLKYFDAVTVPAEVIRIIPPQIDQPDIRLYYEFTDFYDLSEVNYVYFTKPGHFAMLQRLVGKKRNEHWTEEDRQDFSSAFTRFRLEYLRQQGLKDYTQVSEAFLYFIDLYGYASLNSMSRKEYHLRISQCKSEFKLLLSEKPAKLNMDPSGEKTSSLLSLMPRPSQKLKVAFIHDRSPEHSGWTYNHDIGRILIKETYGDQVMASAYNHVTPENIEEILEQALKEQNQLIFTTSPVFLKGSLRAAIEHPRIRILNCSIHPAYKHLRTYYARMYEIKYLMGAIAGSMAENDRIGYIASCPISGAIASINAFALGAKMVNPRVQIHLKWSGLKNLDEHSIYEYFLSQNILIICDKDNLSSGEYGQNFGLYRIDKTGIWNMAMPVWNWGIFYTQTVKKILNGTWKSEDNLDKGKGISYWWGISSGLVDLIYSRRLPIGTVRLIELLKGTISQGDFNPFTGILFSQNQVIQTKPDDTLSPLQIISMDWLAENVVGSIPAYEELNEAARTLIRFQGIEI